MNEDLPEIFINRMRQQLGSELSAFLHAIEDAPVRGVRLNPLKPTAAVRRYTENGSVPWSEDAYYLSLESDAGATVLHTAGAFYIQEPGAMIPAAVLQARPGEKILDLCAAPGGKSTQIGVAMRGEGLLICNEPVPKRAKILSGNIERIGLPNTIVTCALPHLLAKKWPGGFDAVLVDAPCSGEGMFRRDRETRKEWTPEKAEGCAARQREILGAAAEMVRPGGRLVYSTCTYNPAENEKNALWFTDQFPEFHAEPFSLPGIEAPDGLFTCYPHRQKGEGQFVALFRREGEKPACLPIDHTLMKPDKACLSVFKNAFPSFPEATHLLGNTLVHIQSLPDLDKIKVIRIGLHLGEVRGKTAVPDHSAAMWFSVPQIQPTDLLPETVVKYIIGEEIPGNVVGWTLMRYQGLTVGWGKGSGGMIKNHYPKGLRGFHCIP